MTTTNDMTPEDREYLRDSILKILRAAGMNAVPVERIRYMLERRAFRLTDEEIHSELVYMIDKDLAKKDLARLAPGAVSYRLTAAGRDYLEEKELS